MAKITSVVSSLIQAKVGGKFDNKTISSIEYVSSDHSGLGVTAAKEVARDHWRINTEENNKEVEIGRIYAIEAYVTCGE